MGGEGMRDRALRFVEIMIRDTRQSIGRAERKPGVRQEELENLNGKLEMLEWISSAVLAAEDEECRG